MKIWIVLAVWIWWISNESHKICTFTSVDQLYAPSSPPQYPTIPFYTQDADAETYGEMIRNLRVRLSSGSHVHGIPLLRSETSLPDSQRFILVQIYGADGRRTSVTFAIDVTTAYIVAYHNANQRFFFTEAPPNAEALLFTDAQSTPQPRQSSHYSDLEDNAHSTRESIGLGLGSLQRSIQMLYSTTSSLHDRAQSLIVVIQMVSESMRYWYIETIMHRTIESRSRYQPDTYVISLENRWGRFSRRILTSPLFFYRNVTLTSQHGNQIVVDSVNHDAVSCIAILKTPCRSPDEDELPHLQLVTKANNLAAETCPVVEPS